MTLELLWTRWRVQYVVNIKSTKNILRIFSFARKWLLNVKICTHSCHFVVKYKVEKVKF